jgi:hypothetical protein
MTDKLVRLKASVRQIYGGHLLKPGDPFPDPVPERTARGLIANRFAEEDGDYDTRVMMTDSALVHGPTSRCHYRRRDMRAKK